MSATEKLNDNINKGLTAFVTEKGIENISCKASKDIYNEYVTYCEENDLYYHGYINFRKALMAAYDLESIQIRIPNTNKKKRIFI